MRVWLKGFNSLVLTWLIFEKFCGCIWNYMTLVLSSFHCFRSVSPLCRTPSCFSYIHMNYNSHLSLKKIYYLIYFSQHAGLVLCLLIFISVKGSNFRWVLDQLSAACFIFELKEPPAGHVFIFSLLVVWVENHLSLGYIIFGLSNQNYSLYSFI